jgi:hypothetical protein
MTNLMRRGLAALPAIGWVNPVPVGYWRRLQAIDATFQQSRRELVSTYLFAAVFGCLAGVQIGFSIGVYLRSAEWQESLPLLLVAAAFAGFSYWFIRRAGVRYEFRKGSITAIGRNGGLRWRESLEHFPRIDYTYNAFGSYLTLRWVDRRRTIVVCESMRRALETVPSDS